LGGCFYFLHNLVAACVCLALGWTAALVFFDARRGRRFVESTENSAEAGCRGPRRLARLLSIALPLGIVTTIASVNLHMPRYFVHAALGEHQLGIFSAMAYATVSLTLIGDSLGNSAIPKLSRLYAGGNLAAYRALIVRMLALGCAIGLTALVVARGCGAWLLTVFYTSRYAAESGAFTILMAAAALQLAGSMLTAGITSARSFGIQVPLYLLVAGATAWGCAHWVPAWGLEGAAMGVLCGAALRFLLAAAVLGSLIFRMRPEISVQ
jgi:O-antigen/teichoic acid export membrane protein